MDPQTLTLIQVSFQAMSSTAIAAGFLFAAYQFIQTRKAQHFANFTKLVELQMHLREMRVSDPRLAEVYRHDIIGMGSEREIREHFFNLMQLSVFEIVWFGHRRGQIPEDYFQSWATRMRDIAAERSFREMFESPRMKIMHDDFQLFMRDLVRSVPERT
ncbi:MAG: hypothetical protein IBJ11_12720 [Phycisphaerales bacterium]|nr:hypothetical protein [Phycisphaerales bacterium]